jgi:cysteine protease ATG4
MLPNAYIQIVRLFMDHPGHTEHLYSIHNIVQAGLKYDKLPGEWFGPSTAALSFR